jgi:hypothetical protein
MNIAVRSQAVCASSTTGRSEKHVTRNRATGVRSGRDARACTFLAGRDGRMQGSREGQASLTRREAGGPNFDQLSCVNDFPESDGEDSLQMWYP